jgi:hypothetical protein
MASSISGSTCWFGVASSGAVAQMLHTPQEAPYSHSDTPNFPWKSKAPDREKHLENTIQWFGQQPLTIHQFRLDGALSGAGGMPVMARPLRVQIKDGSDPVSARSKAGTD